LILIVPEENPESKSKTVTIAYNTIKNTEYPVFFPRQNDIILELNIFGK